MELQKQCEADADGESLTTVLARERSEMCRLQTDLEAMRLRNASLETELESRIEREDASHPGYTGRGQEEEGEEAREAKEELLAIAGELEAMQERESRQMLALEAAGEEKAQLEALLDHREEELQALRRRETTLLEECERASLQLEQNLQEQLEEAQSPSRLSEEEMVRSLRISKVTKGYCEEIARLEEEVEAHQESNRKAYQKIARMEEEAAGVVSELEEPNPSHNPCHNSNDNRSR